MNYLYGGVGAIILILGIYGFVQRGEVRHLQRINTELQAGFDKAVAANKAQQTTIAVLTSANNAWADKATEQYGHYTKALADLTRANLAREALALKLLKAEASDKLLPACKAILDFDLAGPCPEIADAIRTRAK